jgi:hypothetical protein
LALTGCGGSAAPVPSKQALIAFTTDCPGADGSAAQTFSVVWDPATHKYVNIGQLQPIPTRDGSKAALADPRPAIGAWGDAIYNRNMQPDADQADHDANWVWTADSKQLVDVTGHLENTGRATWIDVKDAGTGAITRYPLPRQMTDGHTVRNDDVANWGLTDDNHILIDSPIGAAGPDQTVVWTLDLRGQLIGRQSAPAPGLPLDADFAFPTNTFAANGLQTTEFSPDGRYVLLNTTHSAAARLPDDTRFAVYDLAKHRIAGQVPIPIGWVDSDHLVGEEHHAFVIRDITGKVVRTTPITLPTAAIGCSPPGIDALLYVPADHAQGAVTF